VAERLFLANSLTVRTDRTPTGLVTTVRSGNRTLPATPELLEAALCVVGGNPVTEAQRGVLTAAGVLRPVNPFETMPERLALRETVQVRLELNTASTSLPGLHAARFSADHRFFESLSVPPYRLGPLLVFWQHLVHLWSHLAVRPDGPAVLGRIAQELLDEDFNLQAVLRDDGEPGAPRFAPLVPLHDPTPQFPLLGLTLQRNDEEPVRVRVSNWADLPTVLRPLRGLAAGIDGQALRERTDPGATALVKEWLAEDLLFEPPKATLQLNAGFVVHLGHGTLLVSLAGKNVLVDPWIPAAPTGPGPIPLPRFALPRLDAVLLTALDVDLADVETLLTLPEETPIYVARQPAASVLRTLGFTQVTEVDPGCRFELGELAVRSVRVAHPAGTGWMLHDGVRGLLALGRHVEPVLDSDERGVSPVFVSRSRSAAPRLTLGWPVLLEPFARWFEAAVPPLDLASITRSLQPSQVVSYCEGGGRWFEPRTPEIRTTADPDRGPLNRLLPSPAALVAEGGVPVWVATPYDVFAIGGGFERSIAAAFTRR
jgi:hypothetical protein